MLLPQLFENSTKPTPDRLVPVRNEYIKPKGGLWTSTYDPERGSDWVQWCLGEDFRGPRFNCWLLYPSQQARIFVIDDYWDLYCAIQSHGRRKSPYESVLDFEELAKDFDAIHLTSNGQIATSWTNPHLWGWDCKSTLWLHWCFDKVESLGVRTFTRRGK